MKHFYLLAIALPLCASAQRILPIGQGMQGYSVNDMMVFDNQLIIGGQFSAFNGHAKRNLVAWDGGNGFNDMGGTFHSGRVDDMIGFNNEIVIGGYIYGGDTVYRWDGSSMTPMGDAFDHEVTCFEVFNNALYAAGDFTLSGGTSVIRVARWNGSAWESLGDGFNDRVLTMKNWNGSLYIGGQFTRNADSTMVLDHLARWNGSDLQPVLSGTNKNVASMVAKPDQLWLAGTFTYSGDSTEVLDRIAKFDGNTLTHLNTGADAQGGASVKLTDLGPWGILADFGGYYNTQFTGVAWEHSPLPDVRCFAQLNGHDYAAGYFSDFNADSVSSIGELFRGVEHGDLEVAGISAYMRPNGGLFHDPIGSGHPAFSIMDEGGASTIYAHSQYVVGHAQDSIFTSSYFGYAFPGNYGAGPRCLDRNNDFFQHYQRTWFMDKGAIWAHAANWNQNGYEAPYDLETWPGNGDISNGEPAIVGPFNDINHNGLYEPDQGELPFIRGDKAAYCIIGDQVADTVSGNGPAGFDTHEMLFGFDEPNDTVLHHVLFLSYQFINRSSRQYDSLLIAVRTDPDVGCSNDDWIGCDPQLNCFYAYNWDTFDEDCLGSEGFGAHPPAQGVVSLNQPMHSFIVVGRDGPSCCNDPITPHDAANYAMGIWKSGDPLINPLTNQPTLFDFSDYPDIVGGFNEPTFSGQQNPDRRGIASYGPFYNVAPGDTICLDLAFVYARDTTQDNIQNVRVLQHKVQAVQAWYDQQPYSCGQYPLLSVAEHHDANDALQLYPNPTTGSITLQRGAKGEAEQVTVVSSMGQEVLRSFWSARSTTMRLPTDALSPGVYLVHLQSPSGVCSMRFVKT